MAPKTGRLNREDKPGVVVIRASGKLDANAGEELVRMSEEVSSALVVVLRDVSYISSSGIAALVRLTSKDDLRLADAPSCVRGVLEIAGVERLFRFFDDEPAALAARPPTA
jgi:anti-anti-sigma factor